MVENHRSLCSEMNEIFMLIGKHFSRMSIQNDFSPAKFWFLIYLYRKGKATVNDLANEAGTTSGATSLALKRLESDKYVVRQRDKVDRRVVWVCLTPEGEQKMEHILQQREKILGELLQSLNDTEVEILQLLLRKMVQSNQNEEEKSK